MISIRKKKSKKLTIEGIGECYLPDVGFEVVRYNDTLLYSFHSLSLKFIWMINLIDYSTYLIGSVDFFNVYFVSIRCYFSMYSLYVSVAKKHAIY